MSLTIRLPAALEKRLRAKAVAEGMPLEELAVALLASIPDPTPPKSASSKINPDWIDHEYHAECEADQSPEVSLEEVRAALSQIPGSMTADFISERDER